ncbi:MAG: cupin domain-containing protein, partial [Candidatus Eisenbacteria bacterium]|nr:cupin domain-containing protein [Candidatus Eisenbacteria bacterium]
MIDPPSGAEVVWTSPDLERVVDYFTNTLGFHIALVFPADDPRETVVVGHGLRLRLCRGEATGGLTVRVPAARITDASRAQQDAPPGVRLELDPEPWPVRLPESRPVFARSPHAAGAGNPGRAGMLYRDLIPGRQGGRYIASQISIPQGGAVPDYVHFHEVHFQMIYCHRGWVRVVYEDQGPPFVMEAGDCVLQPPGIRHRVLESSPGLEVIELSSPAEHVTRADPELDLPTPSLLPGRVFHGQRFLWFRAASAGAVSRSSHPGFAATSLEMADATAGVAAA